MASLGVIAVVMLLRAIPFTLRTTQIFSDSDWNLRVLRAFGIALSFLPFAFLGLAASSASRERWRSFGLTSFVAVLISIVAYYVITTNNL